MAKSAIRKKIAILGGGMSGLTSIKACLEEGLEPVCFEGTDDIGGLWRYREEDIDGISSLAKSTVINTSKETSTFSDFPCPREFPNYMHNKFLCKHFEMYADSFDLRKYIKFNHKVSWVTPAADFEDTGRWSVTVVHKNPETLKETKITEEFDGVMVCTGHHVMPHYPKFEGMESFKGKFTHTHNYKRPNEFQDKNVMVIGTGNSGADAAVEVSAVAEQLYLSTRRGFWIRNRVGAEGYPFDLILLNRARSFCIPTPILNYLEERDAQKLIDYKRYGMQASHPILSQHPTMSDALPNRIICGAVKIKGPIEKFVPEGVIFEGEKEVTKLDAVILATGYDAGFSFIDSKVAKITNDTCELYMYVFPPHLKHPTIAFIGNIQPIGPIFPISELQARWYAQVVTGNVKLPPKDVMMESIAKKAKFNTENFISGTRHVTEVIFIPFCDELAEHFGVKPNYVKLMLTDPVLCMKMFFGPQLPYQYRLKGPHKWNGARNAILNFESRVKGPFETNTKLISQGDSSNETFNWVKILFWVLALVGIILCQIVL